jgi:protein-tyrosine phosphatase
MIDLHCHVLPGIDDGAKTLDDALQLIEAAQQQGITRIIATPHIHFGTFNNTTQTIHTALTQVKAALLAKGNTIELSAAAEVRIGTEMLPLAEQGKLPFLGQYQGMQVLLLELPHSHIPTGADKLVKWLLNKNILPMIAHPERNRELQQYPEKIKPFVQMNCLLQMTAASVLDDMGGKAQHLAKQYLSQRLFDIVASDSHSMLRRPPKLKQAKETIAQLTDEQYAEQITLHTPKAISDSHFLPAVSGAH